MNTFNALQGRIARIGRWIAEHHARRAAIRELSALSDWQLEDIGIERGRIPEIVDGLIARNRAAAAEAANRRRDPGTGRPLPGVPATGQAA